MRKLYAERQRVFLRLAEKYLVGVEFEPSPSGMHLVGWLPDGVSDREVSQAMAERGVRAAPLSDYAIEEPKRGGLLFGYAGFKEREMAAALNRIAELSIG